MIQNNTFTKVLTLCVFSIFLLIGCSSDLQEKTILDLSDDIQIELSQGIGPSGPYPTLIISSKSVFNCSNFEYSYNLIQVENSLSLNIIDLVQVGECDGNKGIASTTVQCHPFDIDQTLTVHLNSNFTTEANIKTYDHYYHLTPSIQMGTEILESEILRIPSNTAFGSISFKREITSSELEKINQLFESFNVNKIILEPGNYGLFEHLGTTIAYKYNELTSTSNVSVFFKYEDWNLVQSQWAEMINDLEIENHSITNYKGETL